MELKFRIYYVIISLATFAVMSCARMEVQNAETKLEYSGLSFNYVWETQSADATKDSLYCIINKTRYTSHYFLKTDANGAIKSDKTVDSEDKVVDGVQFDSKYYLKSGEYTVYVIDKPQEGLVIDSLKNFLQSAATSPNDIVLRVREQNIDDMELLKDESWEGTSWMSTLNSNYPYFYNIDSVRFDMKTNYVIENGVDATIEFKPFNITQKVVMPFVVTAEEGVNIQKILIEFSGILERRYLTDNRAIIGDNDKGIGRIILSADVVKKEGNDIYYQVVLHTLGLIPNLDSEVISNGPGAIYMAIYAEAEGKKKMLRTTKNISKYIKESGGVAFDDKDKVFEILTNEVVLNTGYHFNVTKEQITSDTEDGIQEWEGDGNDFEGEI